MTRSARKEQGRVEILTAAAGLLAKKGYHGMSMRDLAAAAEMNLANLYNYFSSKDELLFALQTRAFETLIAASERAVDGAGDAGERLHAFILNHVLFVSEHPDVMRVLVEEAGELPAEHRRVVRRLKERYFAIGHERVQAVLADRGAAARREPDAAAIERASYGLFGMLNWIYAWYLPRRHGTPQEVARTIHHTAMGGLANPGTDHHAMALTERRAGKTRVPSPIALRQRGIA